MNITKEVLKDVLSYDENSGVFTWKKQINNRVFVGKTAGSLTKSGYICISVFKKRFFAHRLAFLYMTGSMPSLIIDHIDRNRSNNKWSNLREVTASGNAKNTSKILPIGHVHGVSFDKFSKQWRAQIWSGGIYYSRRFHKKDEAVKWRDLKENELQTSQ
jgi:hypothetical protein